MKLTTALKASKILSNKDDKNLFVASEKGKISLSTSFKGISLKVTTEQKAEDFKQIAIDREVLGKIAEIAEKNKNDLSFTQAEDASGKKQLKIEVNSGSFSLIEQTSNFLPFNIESEVVTIKLNPGLLKAIANALKFAKKNPDRDGFVIIENLDPLHLQISAANPYCYYQAFKQCEIVGKIQKPIALPKKFCELIGKLEIKEGTLSIGTEIVSITNEDLQLSALFAYTHEVRLPFASEKLEACRLPSAQIAKSLNAVAKRATQKNDCKITIVSDKAGKIKVIGKTGTIEVKNQLEQEVNLKNLSAFWLKQCLEILKSKENLFILNRDLCTLKISGNDPNLKENCYIKSTQ